MTSIEALRLALSKEEAAITLYRKLASEHPEIKELFSSLVIEEEKHKKLLGEKIAAITKY